MIERWFVAFECHRRRASSEAVRPPFLVGWCDHPQQHYGRAVAGLAYGLPSRTALQKADRSFLPAVEEVEATNQTMQVRGTIPALSFRSKSDSESVPQGTARSQRDPLLPVSTTVLPVVGDDDLDSSAGPLDYLEERFVNGIGYWAAREEKEEVVPWCIGSTDSPFPSTSARHRELVY